MLRIRTKTWLCGLAAGSVLAAGAAHASENGASVYLLGTGGPEAAVLPPIEGVFLANTTYYYDGQLGGQAQLPLHGNLAASVDGTILADFATVLWAPSTDVAGGTLALGAAIAVGRPDVKATLRVEGPLGGTVEQQVREVDWIFGDPLATAMLSWKHGPKLTTQLSTLINVPIGDYREGHISNLAFHRWAADVSYAASWHDAASGWDVSGKTGVTFNGENEATDYTTGTEWHVEGSVEKTFAPGWSAGVQAYWFQQLSGDSGPGAVLGDFKGRVFGLGAQVGHSFMVGKVPLSLRLHAFHEFDAKNRLEGSSVFLDFSMPLWVKLPPGAGGS